MCAGSWYKIKRKTCWYTWRRQYIQFFPGKNLGAFGDAGAIMTNSKKIANFCKRYKSHGALKNMIINFLEEIQG